MRKQAKWKQKITTTVKDEISAVLISMQCTVTSVWSEFQSSGKAELSVLSIRSCDSQELMLWYSSCVPLAFLSLYPASILSCFSGTGLIQGQLLPASSYLTKIYNFLIKAPISSRPPFPASIACLVNQLHTQFPIRISVLSLPSVPHLIGTIPLGWIPTLAPLLLTC